MSEIAKYALAASDIQTAVVSVLEDLTSDWDLDLDGGIGPETRLMGDLSFESIDVVQFIVSLEEKLEIKGIPFENLFMRNGDYVHELTIREIVDFLKSNLTCASVPDRTPCVG